MKKDNFIDFRLYFQKDIARKMTGYFFVVLIRTLAKLTDCLNPKFMFYLLTNHALLTRMYLLKMFLIALRLGSNIGSAFFLAHFPDEFVTAFNYSFE